MLITLLEKKDEVRSSSCRKVKLGVLPFVLVVPVQRSRTGKVQMWRPQVLNGSATTLKQIKLLDTF